MIKFFIGVGFSLLLLGGLVITPYFIEYAYKSYLWFGLNNTFFMFTGFLLGMLFFREFFTLENDDPEKETPLTPLGNLGKLKREKGFYPMDHVIDNDSLGGKIANSKREINNVN